MCFWMLFLDDDYDYKENNPKNRLKMERSSSGKQLLTADYVCQ